MTARQRRLAEVILDTVRNQDSCIILTAQDAPGSHPAVGDMADMVNDDRPDASPVAARTAASMALRIKVGDSYRFYRFDAQRRAAVAEALRFMSRNCDGAVTDDGVGFNKHDAGADFVRGMVSAARSGAPPGTELTPRQAAWSLQCLWKYKLTQLEAHSDDLWPEGMDDE